MVSSYSAAVPWNTEIPCSVNTSTILCVSVAMISSMPMLPDLSSSDRGNRIV